MQASEGDSPDTIRETLYDKVMSNEVLDDEVREGAVIDEAVSSSDDCMVGALTLAAIMPRPKESPWTLAPSQLTRSAIASKGEAEA